MKIIFALILFPLVYPLPSIPTSHKILDIQTFVIPSGALAKYASIVLKYFDTRRCSEINMASAETCAKLSTIPRNRINIYVGYDHKSDQDRVSVQSQTTFTYALDPMVELSPNLISKKVSNHRDNERRQKVVAVLPDSNNVKVSASEHDLIIVVDPFPEFNFGHFLGLFYVDMDVDQGRCQGPGQMYLIDRTCISTVKKPRCENVPEESLLRHLAKCSIDFLPTVKRSTDWRSNSTENLLECVNLKEFRPCPKILSGDESSFPEDNKESAIHSEMRTRCRLFQRCDRALLLGGGWNYQHTSETSEGNILKMESMLVANGFLKENVKIFYGHGHGDGLSRKLYGSLAKKSEIRRHLAKICKTKHCADTFFLYLNTPMTSSGNLLLWDHNQNGLIDDQELYTSDELLSDLAHCEAQRVVVVSDQRRGDILSSLLQKSTSHQNVLLAVAGTTDQPTRNGELSAIWANHSHPAACINHIHQAATVWMKDSFPAIYDSTGGSLMNLSISGAPCGDVYSRDMRMHYQGCQNLPTSIWFSSLVTTEISGSTDEEELGTEGKQVRDVTFDSNVSYSRKFT